MENNKMNTVETENYQEVEVKEKKKFFTKKNLKRIGIIAGGAIAAGAIMLLGLAVLGSKESSEISESEESEKSDDLLKGYDSVEYISEPEESEESETESETEA